VLARNTDTLLTSCSPATPLSCAVSECGEEAVVGCDAARLTLTACELSQCKGPALDLSGGAAAAVQGSSFHGCVGGVFLWDAASASLKETQVEGGKAHVILADGASTVIVRVRGVWGGGVVCEVVCGCGCGRVGWGGVGWVGGGGGRLGRRRARQSVILHSDWSKPPCASLQTVTSCRCRCRE
jgi:hypothetical protein